MSPNLISLAFLPWLLALGLVSVSICAFYNTLVISPQHYETFTAHVSDRFTSVNVGP